MVPSRGSYQGRKASCRPYQRTFTDKHSEPARIPSDSSSSRPQRPSMTHRNSAEHTGSTMELSYACPYAKHNPLMYSHCNMNEKEGQEWRSCSTGLMKSMSRVKQHLSRVHKDRMTDAQQRAVNERISGDHAQGWYYIYSTLFPKDELPATPWAEYVVGKHLRDFAEQIIETLPRLLVEAAARNGDFGGARPPFDKIPDDARFSTTKNLLERALNECTRRFGQNANLSHIFDTTVPQLSTSNTTSMPSRSRPRPPTDTRMAQGMRILPSGDTDEDDSDDTAESDELDDAAAEVTRRMLDAAQGRQGYTSEYPVMTSMASMPGYPATTSPDPMDYSGYMNMEYQYPPQGPYRR